MRNVVQLFWSKPAPRNWTNQDLADFYRIESALIQTGLPIETEAGLSDEGDPWFVFCHAETHEVVVHCARVDGLYIVASAAFDGILKGRDFRSIADDVLTQQPLVVPKQGSSNTKIYLHPTALLVAFVATAFFKLSGDAQAHTETDKTVSLSPGSGELKHLIIDLDSRHIALIVVAMTYVHGDIGNISNDIGLATQSNMVSLNEYIPSSVKEDAVSQVFQEYLAQSQDAVNHIPRFESFQNIGSDIRDLVTTNLVSVEGGEKDNGHRDAPQDIGSIITNQENHASAGLYERQETTARLEIGTAGKEEWISSYSKEDIFAHIEALIDTESHTSVSSAAAAIRAIYELIGELILDQQKSSGQVPPDKHVISVLESVVNGTTEEIEENIYIAVQPKLWEYSTVTGILPDESYFKKTPMEENANSSGITEKSEQISGPSIKGDAFLLVRELYSFDSLKEIIRRDSDFSVEIFRDFVENSKDFYSIRNGKSILFFDPTPTGMHDEKFITFIFDDSSSISLIGSFGDLDRIT